MKSCELTDDEWRDVISALELNEQDSISSACMYHESTDTYKKYRYRADKTRFLVLKIEDQLNETN